MILLKSRNIISQHLLSMFIIRVIGIIDIMFHKEKRRGNIYSKIEKVFC